MSFLVPLSLLLSAGQAIGIPRVPPDNGSGQGQNGSALAQAQMPLSAVPRGFRTPSPFDEDIFDPTHVVSNSSQGYILCADPFTTRSTLNDPLDFTSVKRNYKCSLKI